MQELACESEKKPLAVAKLRKHFLDNLEVEHIVLHAFRYVYGTAFGILSYAYLVDPLPNHLWIAHRLREQFARIAQAGHHGS